MKRILIPSVAGLAATALFVALTPTQASAVTPPESYVNATGDLPAPAYQTYTATSSDASSPLQVALTVTQTSALDFAVTSVVPDSTAGATISSNVATSGVQSDSGTVAWQDVNGDDWDGSLSYTMPGTYTVTDTVTDSNGVTETASTQVTTLGSSYAPVVPTRLLDTRAGTGAAKAKVGKGAVVPLKVAGVGPVPSSGVTAVVLNLTVTDASGSGFITAYPGGAGAVTPNVSNVNYSSGQTVPNLVTVPVGAGGYVDFYNGGTTAGPVDLIADVDGYYTQSAGSLYQLATATRLLDTRDGTGAPEAKVAKGGTVKLLVAQNDNNLPAPGDMTAVVVNITVTNPTGSGFITAFADGAALPNASNVNYAKGQTVSNSAVVPVGANGEIDLYNGGTSAGPTDLIVDVFGYYNDEQVGQTSGAYVPVAPTRVFDSRIDGNTPLANGDADLLDLGDWALGVTSVAMNLTVTNTAGDGYLTVYPNAASLPDISNLDWTKGRTVANMAIGEPYAGRVTYYNGGGNGGTTDFIVDVFGYFQPGEEG